jgi:hypothetical protein
MNKEIIMEVLRKQDLSIRYFENARELLKKAKEDGISYLNIKYVSSASGIAYLSALEALKDDIGRKLTKIENYFVYISKLNRIGKDRDSLKKLLKDIYEILHVNGYYRSLQDKKAIDSGFEKVEKIIRIVDDRIPWIIRI